MTRVVTPRAFKRILKRKRIDNRSQHPHMICPHAIHIHALPPAPDITRTDHNADFYAGIHAFFNDRRNLVYKSVIENTVRVLGQRLAG